MLSWRNEEFARSLARIAANDPMFTRADFRGWRIGDEGAGRLVAALKGNTFVTHLRLQQNGISEALVRALLGVLENSTTLKRLDLSENSFVDKGARAARFRLVNNISDVVARLFVKALLANSSLNMLRLRGRNVNAALEQLVEELVRINRGAANPQEALELKSEWLRNLDAGGLSLLGFDESGVEEEVRRLEIVCQVGWMITSGLDGDKEDAVTLVLNQLQHFMQAEQRRGLFRQLLGVPGRGVEVASSVDETTARTLYRYAAQCGAAPGVLMNLLRAHGSLCTCRDVEHHFLPLMLLAAMPEAEVGDVMELLLINPSLVESGISGLNEY